MAQSPLLFTSPFPAAIPPYAHLSLWTTQAAQYVIELQGFIWDFLQDNLSNFFESQFSLHKEKTLDDEKNGIKKRMDCNSRQQPRYDVSCKSVMQRNEDLFSKET